MPLDKENFEDLLEVKKAVKMSLIAHLRFITEKFFVGVEPEGKKQHQLRLASVIDEKILNEVFNEGIFSLALEELITRLELLDEKSLLLEGILEILVDEDELMICALNPLTAKFKVIRDIINSKLNLLALTAGSEIALDRDNEKTVQAPKREYIMEFIREIVESRYIDKSEIRDGIQYSELQDLLKELYPDDDWESGIHISKKNLSKQAFAQTQQLPAIDETGKPIAKSLDELVEAQEKGLLISTLMPPDVEDIPEDEPIDAESSRFQTLHIVDGKGELTIILPILDNPIARISEEVKEITEEFLREKFSEYEYNRQMTDKIREIRERETRAYKRREEKEGVPLVKMENEDPELMEVIIKKPFIEIDYVGGGLNQQIPFFIDAIAIGGHKVNIAELPSLREETTRKYDTKDFMARISYDAHKKKFLVRSLGGYVAKYMEGLPILPSTNPFEAKPGDKIAIGHYIVTIFDEHAFSKGAFTLKAKELIKHLIENVVDVDRTTYEQDEKDHEKIRFLINLTPEEVREEVINAALEKYNTEILDLLERLNNWSETNPVPDSRIFQTLQLLLRLQKEDTALIGKLPFDRHMLQQLAHKRINRYLEAGKITYKQKKSFFQKLKEDRNPRWYQSEADIAEIGKIEVARFIEIGLLEAEKLTPRDKYNSDILVVHNLRHQIRSALSGEISAEETVALIEETQGIEMKQIFGDEEIKIYNLYEDHTVFEDLDISLYIQMATARKAKDTFEEIRKHYVKGQIHELAEKKEKISYITGLLDENVVSEIELISDLKYQQTAKKDVRQFLNDVNRVIEEFQTERISLPAASERFRSYTTTSARLIQHYERIRQAIQLGPIEDFSFLTSFVKSDNSPSLERLIAQEYFLLALKDKLAQLEEKLKETGETGDEYLKKILLAQQELPAALKKMRINMRNLPRTLTTLLEEGKIK
jgi:hypothetical protein